MTRAPALSSATFIVLLATPLACAELLGLPERYNGASAANGGGTGGDGTGVGGSINGDAGNATTGGSGGAQATGGSASGGDASGGRDTGGAGPVGGAGGGSGGPKIAALAGGFNHFCAVLEGHVWCWGSAVGGALGATGSSEVLPPQQVDVGGPPLDDVTAIAAAQDSTCAIRRGEVWCWGNRQDGALGNGQAAAGAFPIPARIHGPAGAALPTFTRISGAGRRYCAANATALYCWGREEPDGTVYEPRALDLRNLKGRWIEQLVVGDDHACVVANESAYCWGQNGSGQAVPALAPTAVPIPTLARAEPVNEVGAAYERTCATQLGGYVTCWGSEPLTPVVQVDEPAPFKEMDRPTGGYWQFCAFDPKRSAWCWGQHPELWRGSADPRAARITLLEGEPLTGLELMAGASHQTCATRGSKIYCWGAVEFGAPNSSCNASSNIPEVCTFAELSYDLTDLHRE